MTSTSTNMSLLERARQQDNEAWSELVDLYSPLLIRWCHRLGASTEATADCIQDVFTAVARALDTYEPRGTSGSFRGWLWTITRNKLRDAARRSRGFRSAAGGSSALARLHEVPDENAMLSEEPSVAADESELVTRALAQIESHFAPQTWQAFRRCVIDGVSTIVVAEELQLTPAAVRQARSRIMRRLRQQLLDL